MIKCTIAIPVFNSERFIANALKSALDQHVPDMEILVVDNCSQDRSWEILQTFSDARLRLIRNDHNLGLFGNLNRCLGLAGGKYLRFLCADDELSPDCLGKEIDIMDCYPEVGLLSTRGLCIDETGKPIDFCAHRFKPGIYPGSSAIHAYFWFWSHYAYNPFNYPSGVLLRREVALKAGRFNVDMKVLGDIDFFLRVLEHSDLAIIDKIGSKILIHKDQQGQKFRNSCEPMKEMISITEKYKQFLLNEGTYQRIKDQLSGLVLGLALKLWIIGYKEDAYQYLKLLRSIGRRWIHIYFSLMRTIFFRLFSRFCGQYSIPKKFNYCRRTIFNE
jgi:glycosyltransferase involved in cell wall biosynthesis